MADLFDQTKPPKVKPPRQRNELWDVVAEVFRWDERCKQHVSFIGRTAADLKALDATPQEVRVRYAVLKERFNNPGPVALVTHWNELGKPSPGCPGVGSTVSPQQENERKRKLGILRDVPRNVGVELKQRAEAKLGAACPQDWHQDYKWVHEIYMQFLESRQKPRPATGDEIPF